MLGDDVKALGADRANLGGNWEQTSGLGQFFHALGDALETQPEQRSENELSDMYELVRLALAQHQEDNPQAGGR